MKAKTRKLRNDDECGRQLKEPKTREEELKKRAYQTLNQKDYGEWCFAEGKRQIIENIEKLDLCDECSNKLGEALK